MTVDRKTIVNPLGRITTPNHYGQFPEGACEDAQNVVVRAGGELWAAPDFFVSNSSVGNTDDVVRKIFANLDGGYLHEFIVSTGGVWTIIRDLGGTESTCTLPSPLNTTGLFNPRLSPIRSRDRELANSTQGVLVCDQATASTAFRMAGLPQPQFQSVFTSGNPGGTAAIPINVAVAYACILVRTTSDGYIIRSVPSPFAKIVNFTGSSQNITVTVGWATNTNVQAGDVLEIYRTDGLPDAVSTSDPGETLKLIQSITLTASHISSGFVSVQDTTLMSAPFYTTNGRELYTNPGQEGSEAANRQPDINGAQAVFKEFAFYGSITERPQWTFNVPGGIGSTFVTAQNTASFRTFGIGRRLGTGTITNGSNTITGISATEILGLKIGQFWDSGSPPFPSTATITAVGATTVTMSVNATGNASSFAFADAIQIVDATGTYTIRVGNVEQIFSGFASTPGGGARFEITPNQSYLTDVNTIFDTAPTLVVTVEPIRPNHASSFTVKATNGANYSPAVPEFTATAQTFSQTQTKNLLRWSKDSEPEHVPAANEDRVGSGNIIAFVSTVDALWIFCTDGVFRLSGAAGIWNVDIIDPGCVLCSTQSAVDLRETVYAYTNYGFVRITDAGIQPISDKLYRAQLPGQIFLETTADLVVQKNALDNEVLISLSAASNNVHIYSANYDRFTRMLPSGTSAMTYAEAPYFGTVGLVVFAKATAGAAPSVRYWAAVGGFSGYQAPLVKFHPIYIKDPLELKQWITFTLLFDSGNAGQTINGFMSAVANGSGLLATQFNDSYITFGMTQQFAVSPDIQPGWSAGALTSQIKFRGISPEYTRQTVQSLVR